MKLLETLPFASAMTVWLVPAIAVAGVDWLARDTTTCSFGVKPFRVNGTTCPGVPDEALGVKTMPVAPTRIVKVAVRPAESVAVNTYEEAAVPAGTV